MEWGSGREFGCVRWRGGGKVKGEGVGEMKETWRGRSVFGVKGNERNGEENRVCTEKPRMMKQGLRIEVWR